jgi:hypothetical protein
VIPCSAWFAGLLTLTTPAQVPERVTRLSVEPAPVPAPALKYELVPRLKDQAPGNAAVFYYRAFSPEALSHRRDRDFYSKLGRWLDTPARELPKEELRWLEHYWPLTELERGTRCERCDWEMLDPLREGVPWKPYPELHGFRELGMLLRLRARLEATEGRTDAAVANLRTGFTLAKHLTEWPHPVGSLVGLAVADGMSREVESMLQAPGAPNLYWALSELPQPFTDLRRAFQGEWLIISRTAPDRAELNRTVLTPAQAQAVLHRVVRGWWASPGELPAAEGEGASTGLSAAFEVVKDYPRAKRLLIEQGRPAVEVEAIPAPQAVLMYWLYEGRRVHDDVLKWCGLPYWQARPALQQLYAHVPGDYATSLQGVGRALVSTEAPGLFRMAAVTDRGIAVLRCVEAIRLFAAAHEGRLPVKLADVAEVPIPVDPLTGREFDYQPGDGRAVLISRPAPGDTKSSTLRYEISIRR